MGPIWASIWALHGQPIWYPHGFCKQYFDGPHVGFNVGPTWATRGPIWVQYGNSTLDPYVYNIDGPTWATCGTFMGHCGSLMVNLTWDRY